MRFCFHSTKESIHNGKISIVAIAEVIVGLVLYWWVIPYFTDNYIHLLLPVFIAPFMLFGSEQSREGALKKFDEINKITSIKEASMRPTLISFMIVSSIFLHFFILSFFFTYWLRDEYITFIFFITLVLDSTLYLFTVRILLYFQYTMGLGKTNIGFGFITIMGMALLIVKLLSPELLEGSVLPFVFLFALLSVLCIYLALPKINDEYISSFFFGIPLLIVVLCCKVTYTIIYIRYGFTSFYSNWRKICWSQDIYFPPELLPGIENYEGLEYIKWSNILRDFGKIDTVLRTNKLVGIVIVFIPTYLYRISMKATFWFYFPLLLLAIPYKVGELKDKAFFEGIFKPILSWMVCLFAISIVVYSVPVIKDFLPASLLDMLSLEITPFLDKYFPIQFLFYPAVLFILIFLFSNLYSYIVTERTYNSWKRQTIVWGIRVLYALLIIAGFGIFSSLAAHIIPPDYPLIREPFIAIKEFLATWYIWWVSMEV